MLSNHSKSYSHINSKQKTIKGSSPLTRLKRDCTFRCDTTTFVVVTYFGNMGFHLGKLW